MVMCRQILRLIDYIDHFINSIVVLIIAYLSDSTLYHKLAVAVCDAGPGTTGGGLRIVTRHVCRGPACAGACGQFQAYSAR